MKAILVTGASSGIGFSTCALFIKKGYLVFGSVRKKSDAKRLSKSFGENFIPLIFDINDVRSIQVSQLIVKKKLRGHNLTALINNAGIAVLGPLEDIAIDDFQKQLETNIIGTLKCIQCFLPMLGTTSTNNGTKGRIINVSSALGGKIGYPFYGAYCCSKHGLEALSETLRRELSVYGITVSIIAPGGIKTPIWEKSKADFYNVAKPKSKYAKAARKVQQDIGKFASHGLKAETVALKILKAVEAKSPRIRYTFLREFTLTLIYFTPRRVLDWAITKYLNLRRHNSY